MWGSPIKGLTTDGNPINIIVLDSEGLQALDRDANHDNRIFTLIILLSSMLIFNSVGTITEDTLEQLGLICNLTKHVQIKSLEGNKVDEEFIRDLFPHFYWILRDFSLKLVDKNGKEITNDQYLEESLNETEG